MFTGKLHTDKKNLKLVLVSKCFRKENPKNMCFVLRLWATFYSLKFKQNI